MTKTRRQSKAAAAASSADAPTRDPSPAPSVPPLPHVAEDVVSLPEDLDYDVLSALLPDTSLENPSPDAIVALYRLVVAHTSEVDVIQRELEDTRAELQRKDVELDQALQDRESAARDLESVSDSMQNELRQTKQEKEAILASKIALEAQLASVSTSQTSTSTEVESLKHHIEDVEREKRDLVGVVSRLKEDAAQREEEIQTLRSNLKQARQDYQALESQTRELKSTETSTKFKLDSLSQQLQLARDEAERTSADFTAKSEEFAKYRRTKHAEFAQLQAAHDSLVQTHAATESSLKTLQSSYSAQSHQHMQALTRIQDLTGQLAEQEATYSAEAAGLKRLVEMMEEREAQAKAIVENIEKEWAGVGARAERREVLLREEIENERQRAEEAEDNLAELQKVLERVDRGEFPVPTAGASVPSTPARGLFSTPGNTSGEILGMEGMMGLSPTVAIASRAQKSGKTFTEVYADHIKLQEEYTKKCAEYDHMDRTLAVVLAQIEERAPVLAQQRQEYERLQSEASLLASQLTQALAERDASQTAAEENGQKLARNTRENDLLNQQLNDLGRQVQTLLKEVGRRQDPTIPSDDELEADTTVQPASTIDEVITNNLVLFKSIPALQEQNMKLLKVARDLGSKMESHEQELRQELEAEQQVALQEAFAAVKELQDQLENQKKSAEVTIQAYVKERDALKTMAARQRGGAASGSRTNGVNGHDEEMRDDTETTKELMEIRSQFEVYKTEMGADSGTLREELISSRREASQAVAQLAKANAKIEYLTDRQRMLQDQNAMQSKDIDNFSKRNQELYDQYTRIEIECHRVSDDLLSSTSIVEQLRNETANLRAEKNIWESVQARLVDDNKSLAMERSHLSDLMANVQRMHQDLERSGENDRRRLESQIHMMENQTQDLRSQLSQERDAARHSGLQRDLELKDLRIRIDKLSEDHTKTREALVAAETSKKHLEDQVEQITRQLRGNEEKLAVYERRASGAPATNSIADDNLNSEQQLEAEVADLRSALKVAEVDLATAKTHVQQFQDISEANETALARLTGTYDEYKVLTDAQLVSRESENNALQARLETAQEELSQLTQKITELQRTFDTERTAWLQDKKTLEGTIFELTTSERSSENDRLSREDEVRQLEERARAAEDRYGREVLVHAEAIKTVDSLRQQLTKAQSTSRDNLAAAETAQAKLKASESSWKQQKEALDKEITALKDRADDLLKQNNLLHSHLEEVNTKAARIRDAAAAAPSLSADDSTDDDDTKLSELRSVVSYLRKEKGIVDLQLELSKQENTRLRTQVDHLEKALEKTRQALSEERERAVEAAASEAQHAELVERINQLTILRESNATLRAECDSHAKRAKALETKLQQLSSELDPTKEQLRMAKAELEARNQQIRRLEDECSKWQERNTSLLSKYDRIDPAEMQSLKDQIEALTAAKEGLEAAQATHTERVAYLEAQNRKNVEVGKKNNEIMKRRISSVEHERTEQVNKLQAELDLVVAERDALKSTPAPESSSSREQELTQQLEALHKEKASLESQIAGLQAPVATAVNSVPDAEMATKLAHAEKERDELRAERANWVVLSAKPEGPEGANAEKEALVKSRDEALAQTKAAKERTNQLATEINKLRAQIHHLNSELQKARAAAAEEAQKAAVNTKAAVDSALAQQKAAGQADTATTDRLQEELRNLEERLKKQHAEELARAVDAARAASSINPDQQAAIDAVVAARLREVHAKHEQEIEAAIERGRLEAGAKSRLKDSQLLRANARLKDLEAQLAQYKSGTVTQQGKPPAAAVAKPAPAAQANAGAKATPASTSAAAAKPAAPAQGQKAVGPAGPAQTRPGGLPPRPGALSAGRGRGAAVRGGTARGGAPGLSIRGAAPSASEASPAAPVPSDSISITGAASKRPREEGEASGDDSLAKRLKPEGAKPVQLQRNRVPPPPPSS